MPIIARQGLAYGRPRVPDRVLPAAKLGRRGMAMVGKADGQNRERLGDLGLGMMGFPMTRRLLKAGYDLAVWDRSPGKSAALVGAGAEGIGPTRHVARRARLIF